MNQQDVYLVKMRELYAGKIHKDPVWRETSYAGVPHLNPAQEYGSKSSLFIVDWQMECTEFHIVESEYSRPLKESAISSSERWSTDSDSFEKESVTNVFDW
jgi:hypothetical protein